MIFGVTLFLRLLQALLRPQKVRFRCPACALERHELDAVHCKACGKLLKIPDEVYSELAPTSPMSAFGTKRTSHSTDECPLWGKADMNSERAVTSANDPKRN